MYTPPVTPWELVMPEVSDPTPSKHDRETTELKFCCIRKKNTSRGVKKREKREETPGVVLSRGRELPKAGPVTGVKS